MRGLSSSYKWIETKWIEMNMQKSRKKFQSKKKKEEEEEGQEKQRRRRKE